MKLSYNYGITLIPYAYLFIPTISAGAEPARRTAHRPPSFTASSTGERG